MLICWGPLFDIMALGVGPYLGEGAYHRIGTLSSSSNSMTFHDFSMTLNSSTDTNSGFHHNV